MQRGLAWLLVLVAVVIGAAWCTFELLSGTAIETPVAAASASPSKLPRAGDEVTAAASLGPAGRETAPPALFEENPQEPRREPGFERRQLLVQVVDGKQEPVAGVPVALGLVKFQSTEVFVQALSRSPDGVATLPWDEIDPARTTSSKELSLFFPFPVARPTIVPVFLDGVRSRLTGSSSETPIEMVLPPLGRVALVVRDDAGAPVHEEGSFRLWAQATDRNDADPARTLLETPILHLFFAVNDATPQPGQQVLPLDADGRSLLEPVGLGLQMNWVASFRDFGAVDLQGPGPTRAGETVEFRFRLPPRGPVAVGRLEQSDATPVAAQRLAAWISPSAELAPVQPVDDSVVTDDTGRFRIDLSKRRGPYPSARCWLHLQAQNADHAIEGEAHVAFDAPRGPGEIDVGRVRLERAGTLASGEVVDEAGQPVAARVFVLPADAVIEAPRWRMERQRAEGETGSDGRFALTGFAPPLPHVVVAMAKPGRTGLSRLMVPGERDLRIVVRGNGSLSGSLRIDPAVASFDLALFLRRADASDHSQRPLGWRTAPAADGTFGWRDVPAGTVDVVVALGRYTAEPEFLALIDNVAIEVDRTTVDPRLQQIELRGRVPRVDVEVVDPDGNPLDHGVVTLLSPDTHERVLMAFVEKGVAHLATTRSQLDLELRASGYRSERLFAVTPPLRVVLRQGPKVVVVFDPPPDLGGLEEQFKLTAALEPKEVPGQMKAIVAQASVDAHGEARFAASEPGRHVVTVVARWTEPRPDGDVATWRKEMVTRNAVNQVLARDPVPLEVDVADVTGEQRIVVSLPPETRALLAEALRRARGG